MKKLLSGLFGGSGKAKSAEQKTDDIRVAACAVMLGMAETDEEFSAPERVAIVSALTDQFNLSGATANEIISSAHIALDESVDIWRFTNALNQALDRDDRILILETIWRLALADEKLDEREEYMARKLTNLLRLTHQEFIGAKLKAMGK